MLPPGAIDRRNIGQVATYRCQCWWGRLCHAFPDPDLSLDAGAEIIYYRHGTGSPFLEQNVQGALSGGLVAILAGVIPTAAAFLMIPLLAKLFHAHPETTTP